VSATAVRQALATALATVPSVRVESYYPDTVTPPQLIVDTYRVDFDVAFNGANARGMDTMTWDVIAVVKRTSERAGQQALDALVPLVKQAIEADRSLAGACQSLRVTAMNGYAPLVSGETTYLAASFAVQIIATA
jgi:hypothetical protein